MKAKKLSLPLLLIGIALFCLAGCLNNKVLAKPEDTELEFWVAQDVSNVDFSEYYQAPYAFGANVFYGKGYQPAEIIEDYIVPPESCVIYSVTAYPDYSSGGSFVTRIDITDPQVSVYGITCGSALQDFDETFKNLGCTIQDKGLWHTATYGKVKISLDSSEESKTLTVSVEVTNKRGIVF